MREWARAECCWLGVMLLALAERSDGGGTGNGTDWMASESILTANGAILAPKYTYFVTLYVALSCTVLSKHETAVFWYGTLWSTELQRYRGTEREGERERQRELHGSNGRKISKWYLFHMLTNAAASKSFQLRERFALPCTLPAARYASYPLLYIGVVSRTRMLPHSFTAKYHIQFPVSTLYLIHSIRTRALSPIPFPATPATIPALHAHYFNIVLCC